jgi:hypothetical protein
MKRLCVLALAVAVPFAALAAHPIDVTGDYHSNWNDVHLVQHGRVITGTYVCCGGGTIDGELTGDRTLRYRWHQGSAGGGLGIWKLDGDQLTGTWGTSTVDDGGAWNLSRIHDAQLAR